jgi:hypothetical protein
MAIRSGSICLNGSQSNDHTCAHAVVENFLRTKALGENRCTRQDIVSGFGGVKTAVTARKISPAAREETCGKLRRLQYSLWRSEV